MCDGAHPQPRYRIPWWEFTCPVCDPRLHDALTASDPAVMVRLLPRQIRCPLCLNAAPYRRGLIGPHCDDDSTCRVTGMSQLVANRYVGAMAGGLPFSSLHDLADAQRPGPDPRQDLVGKLVQRRAMLGLLQMEVSALIGVQQGSLSGWEHDLVRPSVGHMLDWIAALRCEPVLRRGADGKLVPLAPFTGITWQLVRLRQQAGLTQREVNGSRTAVARWERGAMPSLDDFLDWITSLDYSFEIRELR